MNKIYTVFVSSTSKDLMKERNAAIRVLLKFNCFPVVMEHFPTDNAEPMKHIENKLDFCDYYILILAKEYGSICSDGISYTEKEYDYARLHKIPMMCFVLRERSDLTVETRGIREKEKLLNFRKRVLEEKTVILYDDTEDLEVSIATSIHSYIEQYPAPGWVRNSNIKEDGYIKIRDIDYPDEKLRDGDYKLRPARSGVVISPANTYTENC